MAQVMETMDPNLIPKDEMAVMPIAQRVAIAESIYIGYPRFEEILDKINYCHEFSNITAEPECLLITGPTGAGKSTLKKLYERDHPRQILLSTTKVPILSGIIPVPATVKSLVQHLLVQLKDPLALKGTAVAQTERLKMFLSDCQVELIVLDELQHFIDRDSKRVLKTVSDWLKALIEETRIPVVLLGLPEAEGVIDSNEQLSRRFANRYVLQPFLFDTREHIDEFRTFLHLLDTKLPLCKKSNLADFDMACRIYYATDGVVGYVMKLVRKATFYAIKSGTEKVDLPVLAHAFDRHVQSDKYQKSNPFVVRNFSFEDITKESKLKQTSAEGANARMRKRKPSTEKLPL
ncbi:MAG: AAA family ATPase [Syntrophomonadaceae bacterium]|nr:AAA family ATPase [Syntrophomonadaceae bacterium]